MNNGHKHLCSSNIRVQHTICTVSTLRFGRRKERNMNAASKVIERFNGFDFFLTLICLHNNASICIYLLVDTIATSNAIYQFYSLCLCFLCNLHHQLSAQRSALSARVHYRNQTGPKCIPMKSIWHRFVHYFFFWIKLPYANRIYIVIYKWKRATGKQVQFAYFSTHRCAVDTVYIVHVSKTHKKSSFFQKFFFVCIFERFKNDISNYHRFF